MMLQGRRVLNTERRMRGGRLHCDVRSLLKSSVYIYRASSLFLLIHYLSTHSPIHHSTTLPLYHSTTTKTNPSNPPLCTSPLPPSSPSRLAPPPLPFSPALSSAPGPSPSPRPRTPTATHLRSPLPCTPPTRTPRAFRRSAGTLSTPPRLPRRQGPTSVTRVSRTPLMEPVSCEVFCESWSKADVFLCSRFFEPGCAEAQRRHYRFWKCASRAQGLWCYWPYLEGRGHSCGFFCYCLSRWGAVIV